MSVHSEKAGSPRNGSGPVSRNQDSPLFLEHRASIGSLPVETLANVFHLLATADEPARVRPPYCWLLVTHACRYWRSVALGSPELWTRICILQPACVQVFLERSKQMPLDIECFVREPEHRKDNASVVMGMLIMESHRFHTVLLSPSATASLLAHSFPRGAPLVETLTLDGLNIDQDHNHIPAMCHRGLPSLKRLAIHSWPFSVVSSIQNIINPSLRSLEIRFPSDRPSSGAWALLLASMPLLESLTLIDAISQDQRTMNPGVAPVNLPSLTYLHLSGMRTAASLALLHQLVPSKQASIILTGIDDVYSYEYLEILETLQAKLRGPGQAPHIRTSISLRIATDIGGAFRRLMLVTLWDSVIPPLTLCPLPDRQHLKEDLILSLELPVLGYNGDVIHSSIAKMLCKTFSLSQLQTLSLPKSYPYFGHLSDIGVQYSDPTAMIWDFREAFTAMTNLRALSVSNIFTANDLGPLLDRKHATDFHLSNQLLPMLESLSIIKDFGDEFDLVALHHILQTRKAAGFPLQRVHLCRAAISDVNALRLLKEIVPIVECCTNTFHDPDFEWSSLDSCIASWSTVSRTSSSTWTRLTF